MILTKKIKKFQKGNSFGNEAKAVATYWTSGPSQIADAASAAIAGFIPFSKNNMMNTGVPKYLSNIKDAVIHNPSIEAAVSRDNDAMNSALINNGLNTALMFGPAAASPKIRGAIADTYGFGADKELKAITKESNKGLADFYGTRLKSLENTADIAKKANLSKSGPSGIKYTSDIKRIQKKIASIESRY